MSQLEDQANQIASTIEVKTGDPITIVMGIFEFISAAAKCWSAMHPAVAGSSLKEFAASHFDETKGIFDMGFVQSQRGLQRRSARRGFRKAKRSGQVSGQFHPLSSMELDDRTIKSLKAAMEAPDETIVGCVAEAKALPDESDDGE